MEGKVTEQVTTDGKMSSFSDSRYLGLNLVRYPKTRAEIVESQQHPKLMASVWRDTVFLFPISQHERNGLLFS